MNAKRIVIDGKTYNSVDEMPDDVRRNYEEAMKGFAAVNETSASGSLANMSNLFADNNNNGVPDIMEGAPVINVAGALKYIVDGKVFSNVDALPPEARAKYEQAMSAMDKDRNGVPDFLEGMMNGSNPTPTATANIGAEHPRHSFFDTSKDKSQFGSPTIEPESSGNWIALIAGIALAGLCLVGSLAGVWYFFLR